jgi:hypothetical protein
MIDGKSGADSRSLNVAYSSHAGGSAMKTGSLQSGSAGAYLGVWTRTRTSKISMGTWGAVDGGLGPGPSVVGDGRLGRRQRAASNSICLST